MTFLSMTDEKDSLVKVILRQASFFFPPVKALLYVTANSLHRLPINFLYGYALMVVFAKWRPASLYEYKICDYAFLGAFRTMKPFV
mgnify:CR=1 FL=1